MRTLKLLMIVMALWMVGDLAYAGKVKVQGYASRGGATVTLSGLTATISQGTSNRVLTTYPSCTITVYITGSSPLSIAPIYASDSSTVKANPFTADTDAYFYFYVSDGRYDIRFSGTGITTPFTLSDIAIGNAGGTWVAPGDPTASVGLAVVNGSALTYMRSDAAPPLSQTIIPTWTGLHTFGPTLTAISNGETTIGVHVHPIFVNGAYTNVVNRALDVIGATYTDSLVVSGNATVGGNVAVTGNATVGGNATVTGDATVGGTVRATDSIFKGPVTDVRAFITASVSPSCNPVAGTGDCTAAIQAAITYAPYSSVVLIPSGRWRITSTITLASKDLTIAGSGGNNPWGTITGATALIQAAPGITMFKVSATGTWDDYHGIVNFRDLTFNSAPYNDGKAIEFSSYAGGVWNEDANSRVDNCSFMGFRISLDFKSSVLFRVTNSYFNGGQLFGIRVANNYNVDYGDNIISNNFISRGAGPLIAGLNNVTGLTWKPIADGSGNLTKAELYDDGTGVGVFASYTWSDYTYLLLRYGAQHGIYHVLSKTDNHKIVIGETYPGSVTTIEPVDDTGDGLSRTATVGPGFVTLGVEMYEIASSVYQTGSGGLQLINNKLMGAGAYAYYWDGEDTTGNTSDIRVANNSMEGDYGIYIYSPRYILYNLQILGNQVAAGVATGLGICRDRYIVTIKGFVYDSIIADNVFATALSLPAFDNYVISYEPAVSLIDGATYGPYGAMVQGNIFGWGTSFGVRVAASCPYCGDLVIGENNWERSITTRLSDPGNYASNGHMAKPLSLGTLTVYPTDLFMAGTGSFASVLQATDINTITINDGNWNNLNLKFAANLKVNGVSGASGTFSSGAYTFTNGLLTSHASPDPITTVTMEMVKSLMARIDALEAEILLLKQQLIDRKQPR